MANATELKFGDPGSRIARSDHWTVLLRPRQPTLGSLVVVCREDAKSFATVSTAGFTDLAQVVRGVETMLGEVVGYQRINYLMLMMVDPDVHMHVIPRYAGSRQFGGVEFPDVAWPGPPALEPAVVPEPDLCDALLQRLVRAWPGTG